MLIWQLEVTKYGYTRKENWLSINNEIDLYEHLDDDKNEEYIIYFENFEDMSEYISEITVGHSQHWADSRELTDGNEENLEYHNGVKWDSEIHLISKQVRLHESLIEIIKTMKDEGEVHL